MDWRTLVSYLTAFVSLVKLCSSATVSEICDANSVAYLGSGIIASYNFPFDYQDSLNCRHYIYFYYNPAVPTRRTVCFTFNRFDVEYFPDCFNDYVSYPGNPTYPTAPSILNYCKNGISSAVLNSSWPISNVFNSNFCWPVDSNQFIIQFMTDALVNKRGYFATFQVFENGISLLPVVPNLTNNSCQSRCLRGVTLDLYGNPTCTCRSAQIAPCSGDSFTCFNRNCVNSQQVCDGADDCGDNSDESFLHARCGSESIEFCDFENDVCGASVEGWYRDTRSDYGPRYDHTIYQMNTGYFVYTNFSVRNETWVLFNVIPQATTSSRDRCLSFWYFMSGYVGSLVVYVNNNFSAPLWIRTDNYGNQWLQGEIDFSVDNFPIAQVNT